MNIRSLDSSAVSFQRTAGISISRSSQTDSAGRVPQDQSQVSEFGKRLKELEELRTADPEKYKEVTGKVAARLEQAAKSAAENGDTRKSDALNDLASEFERASETGEAVDLGAPRGGRSGRADPPPPASAEEQAARSNTENSLDAEDSIEETSRTESRQAESGYNPVNAAAARNLAKALAAFQQEEPVDPRLTLASILKKELAA
jgi:hypothetical protein